MRPLTLTASAYVDGVSRKKIVNYKGISYGKGKGEIMRHIEVKYQNDTHAFVDNYLLKDLIRSKQIKQFFRPSEKRWISIETDPVRSGKSFYWGKERRRVRHFEEMIPLPERGKRAEFVS